MAYSSDPTATPAQLALILQELGPASADVESIVHDDDSWTVKFENGKRVHLSWREDPPRLELMSPSAALPDVATLEAHRVLLMFNFLSADSGGCRVGLSAVDDILSLIHDLPEASLSLQAVQSAVRRIADLGGKWELVLNGLSAEGEDRSAQALLMQQFA